MPTDTPPGRPTEADREPLSSPEITQISWVTSRLPPAVLILTGRPIGEVPMPDDIHNRREVRIYLAALCRRAADLLESQP